jgi:methionine-rich copper-binding protein CopC
MKRTLLIILGLIVIGGSGWFVYGKVTDNDDKTNQTSTPAATQQTATPEAAAQEEQTAPVLTFANPKKSAHYVSNTPEHGSTLDAVPSEVALTFNFDLSEISTISITKDGKEYSTGAVSFGADKLSMRKAVASGGGSGAYTVNYNACWPDGSCHDGHFQFGVK